MTDKEQIIINGINIFDTLDEWADFLSKEWCSDERPIVELVKIYISDINGQLARKTKECDELLKENNRFCDERVKWVKCNTKYRKALEEIEDICNVADRYELEELQETIFNIINKAKGENNGINDNSK